MHLIGHGAYAEVWAEDLTAFKLPTKNYDDCTHVLLREAILLRHNFGVPLTSVCTQGTKYHGIGMPKAVCTLEKWPLLLEQHNGPIAIAFWASRILAQLKKLHAAKLVHNDIKGSNILIFESGDASLCDFGLASFTWDHPYVNMPNEMVMYTPNYRPPEFLDVDTKDLLTATSGDIWAFGITVMDCLLHLRSPDSPAKAIKDYLYELIPETREKRQAKFMDIYNKKYVGLTKTEYAAGTYLVDLLAWTLDFDRNTRPSAADILQNVPWSGTCPRYMNVNHEYFKRVTRQMPRLFTVETLEDPSTSIATDYPSISDSLKETLASFIKSVSRHLQIPQEAFKPAYSLFQIFDAHLVGSTHLIRCFVACVMCAYLYRPAFQLTDDYCSKMCNTTRPLFQDGLYEGLLIAVQYPSWTTSIFELK